MVPPFTQLLKPKTRYSLISFSHSHSIQSILLALTSKFIPKQIIFTISIATTVVQVSTCLTWTITVVSCVPTSVLSSFGLFFTKHLRMNPLKDKSNDTNFLYKTFLRLSIIFWFKFKVLNFNSLLLYLIAWLTLQPHQSLSLPHSALASLAFFFFLHCRKQNPILRFCTY